MVDWRMDFVAFYSEFRKFLSFWVSVSLDYVEVRYVSLVLVLITFHDSATFICF